ncbi:MAG: type III PLP-dependent enzyme, partial [Caulobacterales bacterium]|nr:type III PLP-dependent enzyme [Caulobacterales bacterium]
MTVYESTESLVRRTSPERATACARPHLIEAAARRFRALFPGRTLYAVKANPAPWAIAAVRRAGVTSFDVASEPEFEAIADVEGAHAALMHPVKGRGAIARAYFERGCRTMALDHEDELAKILAVTGGARDLSLFVRASVSNAGAVLPLEGKFGASPAEAPALLRAARRAGARLGVAFHVGSQCMDPASFTRALDAVGGLVREAGVRVDIINVGGGFPCAYPGLAPAPLEDYAGAIAEGVSRFPGGDAAELWCEPGRAIAAEGESILTRIELRKGDALYLNDGAFGHLYDAAHESWRFPARLIRPDGASNAPLTAFRLWGPTCDAADHMPGP